MDESNSSANSRESQDQVTIKPFANQGHYTAVHDAIPDVIMPRISGNQFKILFFILRKTRGWKKFSDKISVSQIMAGTGIKSEDTVRNCLAAMVDEEHPERGLLLKLAAHDSGEKRATEYALNEDYEMTVAVNSPKNSGSSKSWHSPKNSGGDSPKNSGSKPAKDSPKNSGDNNHRVSQEPSRQEPSTGKSNDLPGGVAENGSPPSATEEPQIQDLRQYAVSQLMERVNASRDRGTGIHEPLDRDRAQYAAFFVNRSRRHDIDTLLQAFDYMVAKAGGEIPGEPKAWCGFDTALDRVLAHSQVTSHNTTIHKLTNEQKDQWEQVVEAVGDRTRGWGEFYLRELTPAFNANGELVILAQSQQEKDETIRHFGIGRVLKDMGVQVMVRSEWKAQHAS